MRTIALLVTVLLGESSALTQKGRQTTLGQQFPGLAVGNANAGGGLPIIKVEVNCGEDGENCDQAQQQQFDTNDILNKEVDGDQLLRDGAEHLANAGQGLA